MTYEPLVARFAMVDAANPELWALFQRFTFDLINIGFQHHSARAVLHRVRWETATPLDDGSSFKINSIWSPFYARKFHACYPEHGDFFRLRRAAADAMDLTEVDPMDTYW